MKKISLCLSAFLMCFDCYACVSCNQKLQEAIYDDSFLPNLITMLSAFIVLAVIVIIFSILSAKNFKRKSGTDNFRILNPVPLSNAAIVTGIGIGGFIDGILLHQILQWHEMISYRLPPSTLLNKSVNMFWDGTFHLFCLIVVLTGVILLWNLLSRQNINKSGKLLTGGLIFGWGVFNVVEGIIDHQLLKLHNVKEITPNVEFWNIGFLVLSLIMLSVGFTIMRKASVQPLTESK